MAALLYQDDISIVSPVAAMVARVERFQTDSYSVRAQKGINGMDEKWTISWVGLTASRARGLSNQLQGAAITLVQWTPDPFTDERSFTCESHSITPIMDNGVASSYMIDAVLAREYDIIS